MNRTSGDWEVLLRDLWLSRSSELAEAAPAPVVRVNAKSTFPLAAQVSNDVSCKDMFA